MPTVIVTHQVKDSAHWLASPRRQELFSTVGITNIRTFVDPKDATHVGLVLDVPDLDKWTALLNSQAGADAMVYDGVLPETRSLLIQS